MRVVIELPDAPATGDVLAAIVGNAAEDIRYNLGPEPIRGTAGSVFGPSGPAAGRVGTWAVVLNADPDHAAELETPITARLTAILLPSSVPFYRAIREAERKRYPGSETDPTVISLRVSFEYGASFARNYIIDCLGCPRGSADPSRKESQR